jgi:hypothetical protein
MFAQIRNHQMMETREKAAFGRITPQIEGGIFESRILISNAGSDEPRDRKSLVL